jgi:hypothetical protein
MSADWLRVSLRAWAPDTVVGDQLAKTLALLPNDGFRDQPGTERGQTSLIYFVDEERASHADFPEPSESFASAVERSLLRAATWLRGRPAGVFEECRRRGWQLDVFVGSWIDQDQFDLDLPAAFLLACGQAELAISIVTND